MKGTRTLLWVSPECLELKCYNISQIIRVYDIDSTELCRRMYDHWSQRATGREIDLWEGLNAFAVRLQSFLVEYL